MDDQPLIAADSLEESHAVIEPAAAFVSLVMVLGGCMDGYIGGYTGGYGGCPASDIKAAASRRYRGRQFNA